MGTYDQRALFITELPVCIFFILKYFLKGNTLGMHIGNMHSNQKINNL